MPWHHNDLSEFTRCRPGDYGPLTAKEATLRATVDACPHKRTVKIGKSACLHCKGCGSTYLPDVTGKPSRAMHSTPGGSGSGLEHLARMHRIDDEREAAQLARLAERDEGGMAAPPGEKAIVDAPRVKGRK